MKGKSPLLAAALGFLAAGASAATETCTLPTPPRVVINDGKQFLQSWELDDSPIWTSGLMPDTTAYWRFVQYVKTRMDVSEPSRYIAQTNAATPADAKNAALMLAGKTGKVSPITCLEALLFEAQAERRPMETRPTEFLAFILKRDAKDGAGRLKIWFYTVDQPGIGRLGPIKGAAEDDVASGWKPYMNLHNHNFVFDKTPVVCGVPWPSAIDAQLMKGLTLKERPFEDTAVTNGFVTAHLRPEELQGFDAGERP